MRPGRSDPHTLAGAYALDAVPEADRARFERHLAGCESCRQEVRGLRAATAALGAASTVRPPAALREAALRAAGQARQLPPALLRAPAPWVPVRRRRRPGWGPRLAVALAGALAAVAVAAGLVTQGLQGRLDQAQRSDRAVAAVLSAPDATMLTRRVRSGGSAAVVMSHRERALVFTVTDLRVLPSAESYELWLIGPSGSRPAGMITGSGRGKMAGPMVVSGISAGDSIGLTVEPVGGSPRPTSPLILFISLSS